MSLTHVVGQANTALSNLVTPTKINRDLSPGTNNTLNLGVGAFNWKNVYVAGLYYLKNLRVMHAPGTSNFFAGPNAGNLATTGTFNASLGNQSLELNTTGSNNTAVGHTALRNNTLGGRNTAVGLTALYNNTSGGYNTATGERAMYNNKTGIYNTATGSTSLFANTSGANNSGFGYRALYSNTVGYSNVAMGASALSTNTSGSNSVAIGDSASLKSTVATFNVAVGSKSMMNNGNGSYNIAIGYRSLVNNTGGNYNTSLGTEVLASNLTGGYNTGAGYQSLYYNASGYNTAYGAYSSNSANTGNFNVSNGFAALYLSTTGSYNAGLGAYALYSNITGNGNAALGYFADVSSSSLQNATAIGYNAIATASNQIMLGGAGVTSVKAANSVVIYSDGRYKKQIEQNVPGLAFIKLLRPVTYHYAIKAMNEHAGVRRISDKIAKLPGHENMNVSQLEAQENAAIEAKEKIVYTGFIAQEVETAAQKVNYDFNGVYKPQNDQDVYGLSYESFVVPVVKSIQELSAENDSLKNEISTLKQSLAQIHQILNIKPTDLTLSGASIAQNSPNPFKSNTTIAYCLPQTVGLAQLVIFDAAGKTIKQFTITGQGRGTVKIDAARLPSGTYNYTLYIDGKMVETKKMVLIK